MIYRIRHLKCDEIKPTCNRCVSAGLRCDGYMYQYNPQKSKRETKPGEKMAKVALPRVQNPRSSIEPSLNQITGSNEDKKWFHFFRSVTVQRLTGHFDTEFWTYRLLQICHSESGVWHSVLALGALHEEFMVSHEVSRDNTMAACRFALQHYNKAIRVLTRTKQIDAFLISCLLFIIMELLLGNVEGAIDQLHGGIKIICSRKAEIARLVLETCS
jgi:hypothetical protein